jgi:hypothetical protein
MVRDCELLLKVDTLRMELELTTLAVEHLKGGEDFRGKRTPLNC